VFGPRVWAGGTAPVCRLGDRAKATRARKARHHDPPFPPQRGVIDVCLGWSCCDLLVRVRKRTTYLHAVVESVLSVFSGALHST